MAPDISSLRCLNSQALLGGPKSGVSCDTPAVSDPYLVLCTPRNLEKQNQLQRVSKNPTGQNSGLIFRSELLTSEQRSQRAELHLDQLHAPLRSRAAPGNSAWGERHLCAASPEKGENRRQAREPPAPSTASLRPRSRRVQSQRGSKTAFTTGERTSKGLQAPRLETAA